MNADAAAQKHRHTPRTEQVDSTKNKKEAIEAYSDTTNADAEDAEDDQYITYRRTTSYSSSDLDEFNRVMDGVGGILGPMTIGLVAIVIIFLLAPLLIIVVIFYFVNKNRRERYKLAQMAMQNGQPIPDDLLKEKQDDWDRTDYQAGVRQMFTGVGLAIFLGFIIGKIGIGVGALVFFIGLGKWYIARQDRNNRNDFMNRPNNNMSNHSNIQNYE
jgi:hypothetical protein